MISEGHSVVHGTGQRGGRRRPRGGLLVRQETDPPDPQAPRGCFALGHLGGAPDLQDGHAETPKRARGEGARRAVVQGGWPWATASGFQTEQELRDPLPGGVHAHDPLRPEFHRGKARAGRRRAAPPATGARGARCGPPPDPGYGPARPRNVPIRKNPKLSREATPQTTASFQFFRWMAMIPPKIAKACA